MTHLSRRSVSRIPARNVLLKAFFILLLLGQVLGLVASRSMKATSYLWEEQSTQTLTVPSTPGTPSGFNSSSGTSCFSTNCSQVPPEDEIDPRYGVEKRLVPTGPNPLHN